jgi:hypothetical protein
MASEGGEHLQKPETQNPETIYTIDCRKGVDRSIQWRSKPYFVFGISADGSSICGVHELPMPENPETSKRSAP